MDKERIRPKLAPVQELMKRLYEKGPRFTPPVILTDIGLVDLDALREGEMGIQEFLGRCAAIAYQADQLIVDELRRKPEGRLAEEVNGLLAVAQNNRQRIITGLICRGYQLTKEESLELPVTPELLTKIDPLLLASAYDLALLDCLERRISLPQLVEIINAVGALAHKSAIQSRKEQLYKSGLLTPTPVVKVQAPLSIMCRENARNITVGDPFSGDIPLERGVGSEGSYLRTVAPGLGEQNLQALLDEIRLVGGTTVEQEGVAAVAGEDYLRTVVRVDFPFGYKRPIFGPPFDFQDKSFKEILMGDGESGLLSLSKN